MVTTIRFHVCDVDIPGKLFKQVPVRRVLEESTNAAIEAFGWRVPELAYLSDKPLHPFVQAAHVAFALHYPLVISVDHLWLLLCQGLANHVRANAETVRHRFVQHEGKVKLTVRRDEFINGSPDNDWEGVFAELVDQIRTYIGPAADLITGRFSTTGPIEQAAFHVTLMDTVSYYFESQLVTLCGIPDIILEGTPEDWQNLLHRFQEFQQYDLDEWVEVVVPILEEFVRAAQGQINKDFWNGLYKLENESGGPYISGWIIKLIPYISAMNGLSSERVPAPNPWATLNPIQRGFGNGLTTAKIPAGLSSVPFKWAYLGSELDMRLLAGFVGVSQDRQSFALRPEIGWGVGKLHETASAKREAQRRQDGLS